MDAHALLTSQGWRGTGNSLHPTSNTIGLSKPLLVSKKDNVLGLGKKPHRTSDMWWMNAFDKSLQGLDTSKEGQVVQTITNGGLDMVAKGGAKFVGNGGGLYASFVRGECLSGTLTPEERAEEPVLKKRRKEEGKTETKEERRARKDAKRAQRAKESSIEEPEAEDREESLERVETKEERKERKRQKKLKKEKQKAVENSSEKAKRKKRRKE